MKHRTVGLLLIAAATLASLTIRAAEPERIEDLQKPATVDDSKAPPQPALTLEREGDKFTALKIHGTDGKVLAIMWPDGRVDTVGKPDDAARAFWEAFSGYVKNCTALQIQAAESVGKTAK